MQRRRTKEDARAYAVNLTDKGRNLLRKALPLVRKVDERILAALPGRSGEAFIERLAAICRKTGSEMTRPEPSDKESRALLSYGVARKPS